MARALPIGMRAASPKQVASFVTERLRARVKCELGDHELESRTNAENSLRIFIEQAWPLVEPRKPFIPNWHIDGIAEHLEAVSRGQLENLLINIPPGMGKSLEVAVFWFCWTWARDPWTRWLCASYAQLLSTRDSLKCRRILESAWYQRRWPGVRMAADQNEKTRFENEATGYRVATSVGGSGTGERGDFTVIDDPHKVGEVESDAQRGEVIRWHDSEWYNRVAENGRRVVVMQRLHQQDLSGHLLELGGWEHLCLPMAYEPEKRPRSPDNVPCATSIGWKDPRAGDGELLWPARYPEGEVEKTKRALGSTAYAGQYQQRATPREGALFKVTKLVYVDDLAAELPKGVTVVAWHRGWDKAGTEGGGKYTAGVKLGKLSDGRYLVADVVRGQWSALKREDQIRSAAEKDGVACLVSVEQEPASGGKESAEATIRNLAGFVVTAVPSITNKEARATPFAVQIEAGNVIVLRRPWTDTFVGELQLFPNGTYTDQADGAAIAFNKLAVPRAFARVEELML